MKSISINLSICAVFGASMAAHAAPVLFPNGDFDAPDGADWGEAFEGAQVYSYPASDGNPGGYAEITSEEGGGWAVLVSNSNQPYPLEDLDLVAGETYTFTYDMITSVAGPNKGGVKLESWSADASLSNSGDQRVTSESTGWASYTYDYTIDSAATHIKIVPLWTPNETVGFDNIGVDNTPIEPPVIMPVIPNGDFEIPDGASWAYFTDGFEHSYPTTGGNPDGNAVIDGTTGGTWAVLVANNNAPQTLASLGLTAGETYTFQMDMKLLSGSNVGGIKVEFVPGFSGELFPTIEDIIALPNPVTQWNTYSFDITLPATCSQIQVVPLGRKDAIVAFDNVRILLPEEPLFAASIATGVAVSWTESEDGYIYQPQRSVDGEEGSYTDLGPPITGTEATSVFDPEPVAFYQVVEIEYGTEDAILNGSFEDDDGFEETAADFWEAAQSQPPVRILTDAHSGDASMQLKVENPGTTPNGSELQQNVANSGGSITGGNTYDFSFWSKQISSGPSYVQLYKVSWLGSDGGIVGDGGWQNFGGTIGAWEEKTQLGLVAPEGAESAFIQIQGATGAVEGGFGEVIIDDVSMTTSGIESEYNLPATTASAVGVSWNSVTGQNYQAMSSSDLSEWSDFGDVVSGNDSILTVFEATTNPRKFYSVTEVP